MKIQDNLKDKTSRFDSYWTGRINQFYKDFLKGETIKEGFDSVEDLTKMFKLKGFQYGNWLTEDDRFNYTCAIHIALHDLNRVLRFKSQNLGLDNTLGIAFGARGNSKALAHYEAHSDIINLTRYLKFPGYKSVAVKNEIFVNSGGSGAFAHEYGHFLDYYFGRNYDTSIHSVSLSGGASVIKGRYNNTTKGLRFEMDNVLEGVIWKDKNKNELSDFYIRCLATKKDYFILRTEIFARIFEQYIFYKLQEKKIKNSFLTDTKYISKVYLTPSELKPAIANIDRLIVEMKKFF
jgi:hypothetical protein